MKIKVDPKVYNKDKWRVIDVLSHFNWQEFLYFSETLYMTENNDMILETTCKLNPEYYKEQIENGILSNDDLEEKVEYRLMSVEEADAWIDDVIWEV